MNYILWIEDILRTLGLSDDVSGVDIGEWPLKHCIATISIQFNFSGCGASCIYALLAVRQNPSWRMFATEINYESFACADQNVKQNHLNDAIEVIKTAANDEPFDALNRCEKFQTANFSMCNPPFFSDENYSSAGEPIDADHKNRTGKRKEANNVKTGTGTELVTSGGEIAFVKRMICNSRSFSDRINVFTTMLGHKSSLAPIQSALNAEQICNFSTTEFCQGHTMRWAIAWTFRSDLLLRMVPKCGHSMVGKLLRHQIDAAIDFKLASEKLFNILENLDHSVVDRQRTQSERHEFHFVADQNSWSKQRQKRRAAAMMREKPNGSLDSDAMAPAEKHSKLDGGAFVKRSNAGNSICTIPPYLHVLVGIDKETLAFVGQRYSMEINLEYLNGIGGVDSAYQLLQFIKNKWKE